MINVYAKTSYAGISNYSDEELESIMNQVRLITGVVSVEESDKGIDNGCGNDQAVAHKVCRFYEAEGIEANVEHYDD